MFFYINIDNKYAKIKSKRNEIDHEKNYSRANWSVLAIFGWGRKIQIYDSKIYKRYRNFLTMAFFAGAK